MNLKRSLQFLSILPVYSLLLTITSCEKFSGDQTVPSYLAIDSMYLTTAYATQGSASHNITDAWIYIDGTLIGAFEMPFHQVPALYKGEQRVKIFPGIKKNGIASTRVIYPFYAPVEKTCILTEDSILDLNVLKTTYTTNTEFLFLEDFEGVSIALDTTIRSEVGISLSDPGSPMTFEGNHSGLVIMDSARTFFECMSVPDFLIPAAPVFMELNFRSNNLLTVGTYIYTYSGIYQVPILNLNPTNDRWKKIYIDLTVTLNSYSGATNFRIYFGTYQEDDIDQAAIAFDNIKVLTLK
ncbi:MAG: hypothetical protein JW731_17440 [Bacteroidales bacterium]|nr:hypothetical protein [Bacteroidales bacterium]